MIIKYFSWIKEHMGKSEEEIVLPSDITNVEQLINHLNKLNEKYKIFLEKKEVIKIAVNKTYSSLETKVSDNDEIAFFPPVTGG